MRSAGRRIALARGEHRHGRGSHVACGASAQLLGDVPPFAGPRVEPDAHRAGRVVGSMKTSSVRRKRGSSVARRLAAARPGRRRRPVGRLRAIAVALDHDRDDEDRAADRRATDPPVRTGRRPRQRSGRRSAISGHDDAEDDAGSWSSASVVRSPRLLGRRLAARSRRARRRPRSRRRRSRSSCPTSSELSKRIERTAFAPISVAFWTSRSSAWRRVSSSRLGVLVDLAAAERAEAGHQVAAEAAAADDEPEDHALALDDAVAGEVRAS